MKKELQLLLNLYEISDIQDYEIIAEFIENNPDVKLKSYSNKGYILTYYHQFLNGKISGDDLIGIGDIYSNINIHENKGVTEYLHEIYGKEILSKGFKPEKTLYVVDKISYELFEKNNPGKIEELNKKLGENGSMLFTI